MNEEFNFDDETMYEEDYASRSRGCSRKSYKEPKTWTIITALDRVLNLVGSSSLSDDFWSSAAKPIDFLKTELGMTAMQVVVLAVLVETGEPMSWRKLSKFFGCSRIKVMTYSDEIEQLVERRWLIKKMTHDIGGTYDAFALEQGVVDALRNNIPFVPERIEGLNILEFMEMMESHAEGTDQPGRFLEEEEWMVRVCSANPQLAICREVMKYKSDIYVQALLLMVAVDYAQWADSPDEGLSFGAIDEMFPGDYRANGIRRKLKIGNHPLIKAGLIEMKCDEGMANNNSFLLTATAKETLLDGYVPSRSLVSMKSGGTRGVRKCTGIKEKTMFYNQKEQQLICKLTDLLSQDNLPGIQQRLEDEGYRKGFACLFYGGPGTGKTETVLQIARKTGRDIMQVDIAGMRDKFVGESEKNIKRVFSRYRMACKESDVMPILLFNEADALINKRTENIAHSVDKMDNAMQNIILQELEDLDGILIATTNLTDNLDKAFDRRFIFKVKFDKPGADVKAKLWQSMLKGGITDDEAMYLAQRYDFSGGQIENVARKCAIEYILNGSEATIEDIDAMCQNEVLDSKGELRHITGFSLHKMVG